MTGSVVIPKADALVYVIISKEEQYMPNRELDCTIECLTLHTRCRTGRGLYNHVQMYLFTQGQIVSLLPSFVDSYT
jgi:hypothetical protein